LARKAISKLDRKPPRWKCGDSYDVVGNHVCRARV
jgi:hypothetical protein